MRTWACCRAWRARWRSSTYRRPACARSPHRCGCLGLVAGVGEVRWASLRERPTGGWRAVQRELLGDIRSRAGRPARIFRCIPSHAQRADPCPLPPTTHTHTSKQVSCLTRLRVLYLHNALHRSAEVAPQDWDSLRPLARLAFLSVSGNGLAALPPAVADMTQLRVRACVRRLGLGLLAPEAGSPLRRRRPAACACSWLPPHSCRWRWRWPAGYPPTPHAPTCPGPALGGQRSHPPAPGPLPAHPARAAARLGHRV